MDTNTKLAYPFLSDRNYDDIGYCWFVSGDFCTFMHPTPCTANVANVMDHNGWVIYTQPHEYRSNFYNVGKTSYIVTYVKKVRTEPVSVEPPSHPN